MERVGAAGLRDRRFPTLSGGEQQLILIARAIAAGSPVLVLDEPATGLDLKNQARVLTLLRELMADGMALLLSTHHPDHALHLADRVVLLGRSGVRTGSAAELLTDAQLSALYGVRVSTVAYSDDGDGFPSSTPRRTIVVHYGSGRSLTFRSNSTNAPSDPVAPGQTLRHRVRKRLE
jgi:iron complex transport system ATP-binding protein